MVSSLMIVFASTTFAFLCVLVADDLNNEGWNNKDSFFRLDHLHGVGQLITNVPRGVGALALLLPLYEGSRLCLSLNFETGTQYLVPDGNIRD